MLEIRLIKLLTIVRLTLPVNLYVIQFKSCQTRPTATKEYSCLSVCLGVCLSVFLSVCVCVCVWVCVNDNSKNNDSIQLKLEHIVVYENSSDKFDIGYCPIKVKVTA